MFSEWDWDDTWASVGVFAVIVIIVIAGIIIFSPKNVDYYYVSQAQRDHGVICVYAHWTWHPDEVSFCTDDRDRALDFVARANKTLLRSK